MHLTSHIIAQMGFHQLFRKTKTETETKPTQRSQITYQNLRFKRAKHAKRAKRVSNS